MVDNPNMFSRPYMGIIFAYVALWCILSIVLSYYNETSGALFFIFLSITLLAGEHSEDLLNLYEAILEQRIKTNRHRNF